MEYSISRVKGKANLFNKYIHDSEKELNKRKISKTSRKLSSEPYPVENLLEEYLKLIKKRNKVSFSSCMKNERKTKQRTLLTPMRRVGLLGTIEQNIEFLVDKFVGIFKVQPASKDPKLSSNNKISRKVMMKNKKRNGYYVNCNKLSKFSDLNKRTVRHQKNYPYTLEELQSLKRIIELGNIDNNTFMDWNKYGQHFTNTGESQIIPHDSMVDTNKAYLNSMSFINHFTNITPPGMNCIVFYNKENKNYDNYGNINFLNKPINSFGSNEEKLLFKLDKTYNCIPKMPEYLVYTGAVGNKAKTKGKNGNGKQKPKRKKKGIKEVKPKQKQESGGFCFICKRIKTCLCGTKPEVVSESPSAEVYTAPTGMEEMVDPEGYDGNENEFAKQTYVYSALSEPNYDIHNEMMGHEKINKPVLYVRLI